MFMQEPAALLHLFAVHLAHELGMDATFTDHVVDIGLLHLPEVHVNVL